MSARWLVAAVAGVMMAAAASAEVSPPRQTTISMYDAGFGLVSELRTVTLQGDQPVSVRPVPRRIDPSSVSIEPVAGARGFEIIEQRLDDDAASAQRLLGRFLDRSVTVGRGASARTGRLAALPTWSEGGLFSSPLVLALQDGSSVAYFDPRDVGEVQLPDTARVASLDPTLTWSAQSVEQGPQSVRLSYVVDGLRWEVAYDLVLSEDGASARFAARAGLHNATGGRFQDAAVRLVMTEQGRALSAAVSDDRPRGRGELPAQRYVYGSEAPVAESVAVSLAPVATFDLPRRMTLEDGQSAYARIAGADAVPLSRFYVYDGVRFDRFQRNRRNDWNYGTEFHETVETHVEFENSKAAGLGMPLPPGRVNVYRRGAEDIVDRIGSGALPMVAADGRGSIRIGPARGLRGVRDRVAYTEVKPLHEYEESFEIRLENDTPEPVTIRVVEHLYRWSEYEIVKADVEYKAVGPQTIEFRPELKPGGRRTIHYTVRYRW